MNFLIKNSKFFNKKLMKMDPPFRVYTFKMLAKLIYEISKIKDTETILKKEDFALFNEVFSKKFFKFFSEEKFEVFRLKNLQ